MNTTILTAPRRLFPLPEEDVEALDGRELPWETIVHGQRWLLVHDFPLPAGYTAATTSLALSISTSYPQDMLDMVYFYPPLQRACGRAISALAVQPIDGKQWQRWSRHYPWRPGIDCVATHLGRIEMWLAEELKR